MAAATMAAGAQPRPLLVLERIPNDSPMFNMLEIRVGGERVAVTAGESLYVWSGANSTAHRVTIQRVQPGPPLVIQTNTPLAVEPDDRSHLCPQPGINRAMSRAVDRRGHTYQLLSRDAMPAQRWRCVRLQPPEIEELRSAFKAGDDRWTGYTRIEAGGRTLYQAATMIDSCRTVFFERVKGRLERLREFTDCNLEPFVDLDGDGMPEFLAPYSDSADAELKQLFPVERVLATYATGQ
jgi:hypothetical protein